MRRPTHSATPDAARYAARHAAHGAARYAVYGLVAVFFLLRFDLWQQDSTDWWFGLPVGLAYHVLYCLAAVGVLALLVRVAWPHQLEDLGGPEVSTGGETGSETRGDRGVKAS